MKRRLLAAAALATATSLTAPAAGAGQEPGPAGEARPGLERLAFMAGCWEGSFESPAGPGVIEEHYTSPSADLMLGTTRWLVNGSAVDFEFSRIQTDSAGVILTPYPRGVPSEHGFRLTRAPEGEALFEAPEHDFPKRIRYRVAPGGLVARIDGGEGSEDASEWRLSPASCAPPR